MLKTQLNLCYLVYKFKLVHIKITFVFEINPRNLLSSYYLEYGVVRVAQNLGSLCCLEYGQFVVLRIQAVRIPCNTGFPFILLHAYQIYSVLNECFVLQDLLFMMFVVVYADFSCYL